MPDMLTTNAVLLFDRSARLRMQFTGPKAAESLTGLVTNDVLSLRGGDGVYACALTQKGRIIADVRIFAIAGDDGTVQTLLTDANVAGGVGFATMIRKYVNPRTATYVNLTASSSCLTLLGENALDLLTSLGAAAEVVASVQTGARLTHAIVTIAGVSARLIRAPDLGLTELYDLIMDATGREAVQRALMDAGALLSTDGEWHRRRVVAARPEWGIDMDEGTLAQEANMDSLHSISYSKGCYTGQETVARVHFRGHVNRTLRRVSLPDGVVPAHGTALLKAEGSAAGDVRSAAIDDGGALVGIAMVRREVGDLDILRWASEDGVTHDVIVVGEPDES